MENKNPLKEWLEKNGLVLRICNGAVTICDGDCENCSDVEVTEDV